MPFVTFTKDDSGPQVLTFQGKITFGRETERVRQKLKEMAEQGDKRFVFDLESVDWVDSAGIGFLVMCLTTLGQAGARLRLTNLPERVRYVLGITRLNTVFEIFDTRQAALRDFK